MAVGESGLWTLTVRIPELARSVIGYSFLEFGVQESGSSSSPSAEWRGPEAAPPAPRKEKLEGRVLQHMLTMQELGEKRAVSVYLPPDHDPEDVYPAIYMADGGATERYAHRLELLIDDGAVPPMMIVGMYSGRSTVGSTGLNTDVRALEYLVDIDQAQDGADGERFGLHERWFLDEVMPWAEEEFGASDDLFERAVYGVSNGSAFAISMGHRHPDLFANVMAFSFAWTPALEKPAVESFDAPRYYLVAGVLEPGFRRVTERFAEILDRGGYEYRLKILPSGHDFLMWSEQFNPAVRWLFGAE